MTIMWNQNRVILLVYLFIFIFLLNPVFCKNDKNLSIISNHYKNENYHKAHIFIKNLVIDYPHNYEYKFQLAYVLFQLEEYYESEIVTKQIIADDWLPENYQKRLDSLHAKLIRIPKSKKRFKKKRVFTFIPPYEYQDQFHTFYLELLGSGIFNSINYEYLQLTSKNYGFALRAGMGYIPVIENYNQYDFLTFPLTVSLLFGNREKYQSMFELGFGGFLLVHGKESAPYISFICGYRYQPFKSGISFRIAFTPFIYRKTTGLKQHFGQVDGLKILLGISIGYSF